MNLNNIKTKVLACLFIGMVTGCSIEDIKPINQLTEETVITNETSANAVLNRIYNRNRSLYFSSFASVLGYYGIEQNVLSGLFGDDGFNTNNVQDDSEILQNIYIESYAIINEANFFIELLKSGAAVGLSDSRRNEMLAEARFFRALTHFKLLKIFGQFYDLSSPYGVVAITTPIRNNEAISRSNVQETYDTIIADLEYAMNNGPSGVGHIYVSATTAQALLSKVQLYMGDYANAANNALAVINNTDGYALETVYSDIFTKRWNSSEVLFAPFADGLNEDNTSTGYVFNGQSVASPSNLFKDIADASDGNMDGVEDEFGTPFDGYDTRFLYTYSNATAGPNSNGKYPFQDYSSNGDQGNTYYFLRMAEVYLIYAEAEARRPGGDLNTALEKLNDVRFRAGEPLKNLTDRSTLLADIRNDKMIELCSENGEPYFDLIRYDRMGDIDASILKATLADAKHTFPIPASAMAGNTSLVPNPNQ